MITNSIRPKDGTLTATTTLDRVDQGVMEMKGTLHSPKFTD